MKKNSSAPRFTVDVSNEEKERALQIKKKFKNTLRELDDSLKLVFDFKEAVIQDRPSKKDLQVKYRGPFLRYRRKILIAFNELLINLKDTLNSFVEIIDPEMLKLKEIIVAEFDELSDGIESLMGLMKEADKEGFSKSLEGLVGQLQKRQRSIKNVVDDQLFGHLENDILGRMKISSVKSRVIARTRNIRKLSRG